MASRTFCSRPARRKERYGWQYEIGYVNNDDERHGLALWAADEERHATDIDGEEGAEQWLRIEATDDLTSYRCEVNPETMEGDIEIHEHHGLPRCKAYRDDR